MVKGSECCECRDCLWIQISEELESTHKNKNNNTDRG